MNDSPDNIGVIVFGAIDKRGLFTHYKDGLSVPFVKNGIGKFIISDLLQLPNNETVISEEIIHRVLGFYSSTLKLNIHIITIYLPIKDYFGRPSHLGISIFSTNKAIKDGLTYALYKNILTQLVPTIRLLRSISEKKVFEIIDKVKKIRAQRIVELELNEDFINLPYTLTIENYNKTKVESVFVHSENEDCIKRFQNIFFGLRLPLAPHYNIIIGTFNKLEGVNINICNDLLAKIDDIIDRVFEKQKNRKQDEQLKRLNHELKNINRLSVDLREKFDNSKKKLSNEIIQIDKKLLSFNEKYIKDNDSFLKKINLLQEKVSENSKFLSQIIDTLKEKEVIIEPQIKKRSIWNFFRKRKKNK